MIIPFDFGHFRIDIINRPEARPCRQRPPPSLNSTASNDPVLAPDGTAARPKEPSLITSHLPQPSDYCVNLKFGLPVCL